MNITTLINDISLLEQMKELVESGASIGTVEAKLKMNRGLLRKWLQKGEEKPKTKYRRLYNLYREWAAEARSIAETQQLAKNPSQWLDRNTSAKLLETSEEPTRAIAVQPTGNLFAAQELLNALRVIRESGISLDEAVDKDQIAITDKRHESN